MTNILPSNPLNPDSYYKVKDDDDEDEPANIRAPTRDEVHIFSRMHMIVTWVEYLGVLMLLYVGYVLADNFWQSQYFSVGAPVMTRDVNIDVSWKYWLLIAVIAWDRIFASASSQVIGSWRVNHVMNPKSLDFKNVSYSLAMFVLMVDHIVNFLRGAVMVLFIYAQVDFALAFAIPDVIINMFTTYGNIRKLNVKREFHQKLKKCTPQQAQKLIADQKLEKPPSDKLTDWHISPLVLTFLQICELVLFILVFYFIGYFDTPYFSFTSPCFLFGKMFNNTAKLWGFFVFVLIDSVFSTMHNSIVGPYIVSHLQNNASIEMQGSKAREEFIYLAKKVIGWVRIIFMLNFILSNFRFLLANFVSDFFVTLFMFHRSLMNKNNVLRDRFEKKKLDRATVYSAKNYMAYMPLSAFYMTWAAILWMVFVIIFAMAQLRIYKYPYFDWPPTLTVFETVVTGTAACWFIIIYTAVDRAINTLASDIALPYIANVITGCDPDGLEYNSAELFFISIMYDITMWLRRMVAYNFMFSNISLVVFQGFTDFAVSWIIIERYLRFKLLTTNVNADKNDKTFRKSFSPGTNVVIPVNQTQARYLQRVYEMNVNNALNNGDNFGKDI